MRVRIQKGDSFEIKEFSLESLKADPQPEAPQEEPTENADDACVPENEAEPQAEKTDAPPREKQPKRDHRRSEKPEKKQPAKAAPEREPEPQPAPAQEPALSDPVPTEPRPPAQSKRNAWQEALERAMKAAGTPE